MDEAKIESEYGGYTWHRVSGEASEPGLSLGGQLHEGRVLTAVLTARSLEPGKGPARSAC